MRRDTTYHSILRIASLTLAVVLLFDSGLFSPVTHGLSQTTQQYVATAIGINANVVPTELNQLTAELTKRERDLSIRENQLAEREIAVNLQQKKSKQDYSTYIMSVLLFVLLVLIVINYILDYLRLTRRTQVLTHEKAT